MFSRQFFHRLRQVKGRNELLAKAVGFKGEPLTILDATAGLGQDSLLLSALGCQVLMFERHPKVAQDLQENLQALAQDKEFLPLIERVSLTHGCAKEYLQENQNRPDVIYCDPMFEPKSKRALTKKGMQKLQTLVGHDEDAEDLIDIALKRAEKRVVVKRANYSLAHKKPDIVFKGRAHRFDVYLV
jgi:16S rRNA (guanine1516-N2)-methyltransferase